MPIHSQEIEDALARVRDQRTFIGELLNRTLGWPLPQVTEIEDIAYQWSPDELKAKGLSKHLAEGKIWQLQPLERGQPWGVFLLEFKNAEAFATGRGMTGPLRAILRGLVSRRRAANLPGFERENLLFICTHEYQRYRFAYFKAPLEDKGKPPLATFGWGDDVPARTVCEFNLGALEWPTKLNVTPDEWTAKWASAFDVEKVTDNFYRDYKAAFAKVEDAVGVAAPKFTPEERRMYTQTLFNRLMFLRFIERKGWLEFPCGAGASASDCGAGVPPASALNCGAGFQPASASSPSPLGRGRGEGSSSAERAGGTPAPQKDYLRALYAAGGIGGATPASKQSFFQSRLMPLFFEGLAVEGKQQSAAIGKVPFLNGGLFEQSDLDAKVADIPDDAFRRVIGEREGLFYRYNFTVEESTPLDIEVAVDPEMLGKVFEELVTGRHESGSYYTPRNVVSFMCREALKGYLAGKTSAPPDAIAALVDEHVILSGSDCGAGFQPASASSPSPLGRGRGEGSSSAERAGETPAPQQGLTETHAREIEAALDSLKAVDPACGSGAYLLGLLHELVAIHRALRSDKLRKDSDFLYQLKLRIISNNLHGVDLDPFAANIAMLRLWLSIAVDADRPIPLPNLDFKIETGDALLGPDPSKGWDLFGKNLRDMALEVELLKKRHGESHDRDTKRGLLTAIDKFETRIAVELGAMREQGVIDWRVAFADVFVKNKGFDIALANPPYVRQELIKHLKPDLKKVFPEVFTGVADLYCYFYARAIQLLRPGGMLAFISSNKWFRAGYGAKLRKHIADTCEIRSITDFGDLPVFVSAIAYPMIFIARKAPSPGASRHPLPRGEGSALPLPLGEGRGEGLAPSPSGRGRGEGPIFTKPASLDPPYPDVLAVIRRDGSALPPQAINGSDWMLANAAASTRIHKMRAAGVPLGEYVKGQIFYGIKTGFNDAFVIDGQTRDRLIKADPKSAEIIKPLAVGRDIKRWRIERKDRWLIFTRRGIAIEQYPAVKAHLAQLQMELTPKPDDWNGKWPGPKPNPDDWDGKWPGRKPGRYKWYEIQDDVAYYDAFDKPKIVYPIIIKEQNFAFDTDGMFTNDKAFIIPIDDLWLVGLLNASPVWNFLAASCSPLEGGFYEMRQTYISQIPIPSTSVSERAAIESLVKKCLAAKASDPAADCSAWESALNARAAALYGL